MPKSTVSVAQRALWLARGEEEEAAAWLRRATAERSALCLPKKGSSWNAPGFTQKAVGRGAQKSTRLSPHARNQVLV